MSADLLWLGGSPCAGKSSIGEVLSRRADLALYSVDHALPSHLPELDPESHPALSAWLAASCAERWLKPVDQLLDEAIACYTEQFSFILADLQASPAERRILAEGTALLPALVAEIGVASRSALWLVPTPAFQVEQYGRRPWVKEMLADCRDVARAWDNWMSRDIQFAQWVAAEAAEAGFAVHWVDGALPLESTTAIVAGHFGLALIT